MACEGLGFRSLALPEEDGAGKDDRDNEGTLKGARTVCDRAPYFLVLGAQKAGTTALYSYVIQHPMVVAALRKETHFLDWKWGIYANCQVPAEMEADLTAAMAQCSWQWDQHPTHFPALVSSDFDYESDEGRALGGGLTDDDDSSGIGGGAGAGADAATAENASATATASSSSSSRPESSTRTVASPSGPAQPPRQRPRAWRTVPSCDAMRRKYLLMFPFQALAKDPSLVSGEASPSYALYAQVPARLHRLNPKYADCDDAPARAEVGARLAVLGGGCCRLGA
jgi:hypothetical protein